MTEQLADQVARVQSRPTVPKFAFAITVHQYNEYGDRIVLQTPATIIAANKDEVTQKVRAAFGAEYDDFRNFWSHDWTLESVTERENVQPEEG